MIWILGAGGHAKVVVETLESGGTQVTGFLDDDPAKWELPWAGLPVRGPMEPSRLAELGVSGGVIGIGDNRRRSVMATQFPEMRWLRAIHSHAVVAASSEVGVGSVVFAGAILQADAKVGPHVILNTRASVDHDCLVGAFAHLAPSSTLCGGVKVGEGAFIGAGATVLPGVRIGDWAVVGAGAVVTQDVPPGTTVVGVPARTRQVP